MSTSVVISFNRTDNKERKIVQELVDYLYKQKNIEAVGNDPNFSESSMKQQLLNAQWLVLFLTPEAIKSPQVQSLVNAAFDYVNQGHMQGILALAFSSNPVALEDMPSPLWSTIRIYYTGERAEDLQRAFEKLSRTLSYTRVPVRAVSSPANNWASSFSPAASRPLPAISQPVRNLPPRLVIPVVSALILIIFFLAFIFSTGLISKLRAKSTPTPDVSATEATYQTLTAIAKATAAAHAKATVNAQVNATATAVSLNTLYKTDTSTSPKLTSLDAQDDNHQWQQDSTCILKPDSTYDVKSLSNGHSKVCMANNTSFKNFVYQVQMTIKSGDAGGLIFRSDGIKQFYGFSVDSNGKYTLLVCQPSICSDTKIGSGKKLKADNLQNIGQANTLVGQTITLAVIAKDKTINLYVNGAIVGNVDDSTLSQGGEIGVFADSETQSTEVAFSDVKVWQLPDSGQLP